ncbi:MAG: peptidoglycan binding domain-containing protein, partial [Thermoleophilia bacterium]|nr:peptidoglycan binding domain-containing protein [Gaiellaceae bacterium]MDW8338913.1 peptidoglycan binding domain-containing protein [Thermoleophilia bacterium]
MRDGARTFAAGLLVSVSLLGFASVFGLAATAGAGERQAEPPPTDPTLPEPPLPPPRTTIAEGVTVGGVEVGGFRPSEATRAVRTAFERPLVLVAGPVRRVRVAPRELGARPKLEKAIARARAARPGARIPLEIEVSRERLRRYVTRLAREVDRPAIDARARVRGVRLHVSPAKPGRRLQRLATARAIRVALATGSREPILLGYTA